MKTLVIVESPKKAKKIKEYLGEDYIVLATVGHITKLSNTGDFNVGVNFKKQYEPRYALMDDKEQVLDNIIAAGKIADEIIICSDPDREGEAIAHHVYEKISAFDKPIKRAKFTEITKKALANALSEAGEIDHNLVKAQESRQVLDKIVGFMASPYLANTFKDKHLSAGRVQSIVSRMIVDKEREIKNFKPETYWTLQTKLSNNSKEFISKYEYKIASEKEAEELKLKILSSSCLVKSVNKAEEKRKPAAPFITSTIQQVMSKQYKFPAEKTSKLLQSLYEEGIITYIRTDSPAISDDALVMVRDYMKLNKLPYPKSANKYASKDSAQGAHECIRPTSVDFDLKANNQFFDITDPDEKKLYEVIWKGFVASQMNPAVYNTLKVVISADDIVLTASGKALKESGFLEIMGATDDSGIDIPDLEVNDKLTIVDVVVEKKKTQAPARYSESSLIKTLDTKGIGRPSTYASLLTKICDRNYVEKRNEIYYATELGEKTVDLLFGNFEFLDYQFTANVEKQLDLVAEGKATYFDTIDAFYKIFKNQLDKAYIDSGESLCDMCGGIMKARETKDGTKKFLGCSNYPRCNNVKQYV